MTPNTPVSYELVDGEHRFEHDGHTITVPALDAPEQPKRRRKPKVVEE